MAGRPKRGRKRRPRRRSKPKSAGNKFLLFQSIGAGLILLVIVFLIAADAINTTTGTIIGMIVVATIFYFVSIDSSNSRKRNRRRKPKPESSDPQFYTALPSTLGVTELPEESLKPEIKLPPRPIRAARRRRDFIMYPLAVSGGDYSDSYIQVDKDTVLRLRSEMTPDLFSVPLAGSRMEGFPSSNIAAVMSKDLDSALTPVVSSPVLEENTLFPVAAEASPVIAEAAPVIAEAAPVVTETVPISSEAVISQEQTVVPVQAISEEEDEEEIEFDMEWD